jgi:hypothetical protein
VLSRACLRAGHITTPDVLVCSCSKAFRRRVRHSRVGWVWDQPAPRALAGEEHLIKADRGDTPDVVGSSTSGVPYAITATCTVCQSQPSSRATSATVRPLRPTYNVAHRPARSVIAKRAEAILGS